MKLPKGWYAILSSEELNPFEPQAVKRMGIDLVFWRDSNENPVIMEDRCPHRSGKLSLGKVKNDRIQCAYHGFEYDTSGRCQLVPETGKAAEYLRVKTYPAIEENNLIWIYHGENEPVGEPPWFDDLDEDFIYSQILDEWNCHLTRCIESKLDYAHLPYVHPNTIGMDVDVTKKAETEMNDVRIKVVPNFKQPSDYSIDFKFPNIIKIHKNDQDRTVIAFAPVEEKLTVLYVRSYYKGIKLPFYKELVDWKFNSSNQIMLSEIKEIVEAQGNGESGIGADERLFLSDIPIRFFRDKWAALMLRESNNSPKARPSKASQDSSMVQDPIEIKEI